MIKTRSRCAICLNLRKITDQKPASFYRKEYKKSAVYANVRIYRRTHLSSFYTNPIHLFFTRDIYKDKITDKISVLLLSFTELFITGKCARALREKVRTYILSSTYARGRPHSNIVLFIRF